MKNIDDLIIDKFLEADEEKQNAMMCNLYYSVFDLIRPESLYLPSIIQKENVTDIEKMEQYEIFYKKRLFSPEFHSQYGKIKKCFDNVFKHSYTPIYSSKNNLVHLLGRRKRNLLLYFPMLNYDGDVVLIIEYKTHISTMKYGPFGTMYVQCGSSIPSDLTSNQHVFNFDRHVIKNCFRVYKRLVENFNTKVTVQYMPYTVDSPDLVSIEKNEIRITKNSSYGMQNMHRVLGIEEFHPIKQYIQFHVFHENLGSFLPLFDHNVQIDEEYYSKNPYCFSGIYGVCPNLIINTDNLSCRRFGDFIPKKLYRSTSLCCPDENFEVCKTTQMNEMARL